jgi:hypothetical protein
VGARSRLTLLYTVKFALGGAALILITYALARHSMHAAASTSPTLETQQAIAQCVTAAQNAGSDSSTLAEQKCSRLYANGVLAGASAQRTTRPARPRHPQPVGARRAARTRCRAVHIRRVARPVSVAPVHSGVGRPAPG